MDPNTTLATIRRILNKAGLDNPQMDPDETQEFVTAIDALDESLSKGGSLPSEWNRGR